jgi:hypothetical protein
MSVVGPLDVLRDVTRRLEQAGIDYFLVGSLAAMYYSRPRFTNDIDLVVKLKAKQAADFEKHFDVEEYYCPPHEVISDEILRGGSFNLIHQGSGFKVDLVMLKTAFDESEFARRRKENLLPDLDVYIASPEDVLIKKLDFYREGGSEKHLIDIQGMLMETKMDLAYIEEWVAKLGLDAQWQKAN